MGNKIWRLTVIENNEELKFIYFSYGELKRSIKYDFYAKPLIKKIEKCILVDRDPIFIEGRMVQAQTIKVEKVIF